MRIYDRASSFKDRDAIRSHGKSYRYADLMKSSGAIAVNLLEGREDLEEERIAFLVAPSFEYVAVQWAIWKAGGIAVPLCVHHPLPSIEYVLKDTGSMLIIADETYAELLSPLVSENGWRLMPLTELLKDVSGTLPTIGAGRRAMILYTSGTTSKPKGVVTTHRHIEAQITTLVNAWEWEEDDCILNTLPLHHVHGIINAMSCALWVGACCEFLAKFDAAEVWDRITSGSISLFMGVPTMYYRLIGYWEEQPKVVQEKMSEAVSRLRLMVSGSAALPVKVFEKWQAISGHTLLERYGMTEIGMGLGNPYRGERRPGHVGQPFEGVSIKLVNADLSDVAEGEAGEILIKGPSVFDEYWNKPEATKAAFTADGWFITGDTAQLNNGSYKILGRNSVDIIKSGGYKISALEIEDVLRRHPDIDDCAVVGVPDEEWGELITAVVVSSVDPLDYDLLGFWIREQLPAYKIPRKYVRKKGLPRNVLGKVTKSVLKSELDNDP